MFFLLGKTGIISRMMKYEYLNETYHSEAIIALRQIRQIVENDLQVGKRCLQEAEAKLVRYSKVKGFEDIINEYEKVLKEIENAKWTLSNLASEGSNE